MCAFDIPLSFWLLFRGLRRVDAKYEMKSLQPGIYIFAHKRNKQGGRYTMRDRKGTRRRPRAYADSECLQFVRSPVSTCGTRKRHIEFLSPWFQRRENVRMQCDTVFQLLFATGQGGLAWKTHAGTASGDGCVAARAGEETRFAYEGCLSAKTPGIDDLKKDRAGPTILGVGPAVTGQRVRERLND